jgi:hypothetical protein
MQGKRKEENTIINRIRGVISKEMQGKRKEENTIIKYKLV